MLELENGKVVRSPGVALMHCVVWFSSFVRMRRRIWPLLRAVASTRAIASTRARTTARSRTRIRTLARASASSPKVMFIYSAFLILLLSGKLL